MIDLSVLAQELRGAGVIGQDQSIGRIADARPHTFDASGAIVPLPPEADAVISAHKDSPPSPPRDQLLIAALEAPQAALATATSLDELKSIIASALDGLALALGHQSEVPQLERKGAGVIERGVIANRR